MTEHLQSEVLGTEEGGVRDTPIPSAQGSSQLAEDGGLQALLSLPAQSVGVGEQGLHARNPLPPPGGRFLALCLGTCLPC